MIATMMILAGMLMMVWPLRQDLAHLDETLAGHALREAFCEPTHEPLPPEIEQASQRVAAKLRIVRTSE